MEYTPSYGWYRQQMWNSATIPEARDRADALKIARRIHACETYARTSGLIHEKDTEHTPGEPIQGFVLGILHQMEAGGAFEGSIKNGARIRPVHFDRDERTAAEAWIDDTVDICQTFMTYVPTRPGEIGETLYVFEAWNGFGYLFSHPETPSAYLWSGTNHARLGKYVGPSTRAVWDPVQRSKQIGVVAIMKAMVSEKLLKPPKEMKEPPSPRIKLGSVGFEVVRLQQYLNSLPGDPINVDGIYGEQTERRLKQILEGN